MINLAKGGDKMSNVKCKCCKYARQRGGIELQEESDEVVYCGLLGQFRAADRERNCGGFAFKQSTKEIKSCTMPPNHL